MNGVARQFEPQITRSGGAPSKFRFTVRCSDCANTDSYEASRPTRNEAVRGYFKGCCHVNPNMVTRRVDGPA
jgi:hypothetical protein